MWCDGEVVECGGAGVVGVGVTVFLVWWSGGGSVVGS